MVTFQNIIIPVKKRDYQLNQLNPIKNNNIVCLQFFFFLLAILLFSCPTDSMVVLYITVLSALKEGIFIDYLCIQSKLSITGCPNIKRKAFHPSRKRQMFPNPEYAFYSKVHKVTYKLPKP